MALCCQATTQLLYLKLLAYITLESTFTLSYSTETTCTNPSAGDFCFVTNDVTFDTGANDLNIITVVLDVFDDLLVEGTESFTVTATITDPGVQTGGIMPTFMTGTNTVDTNILDNDFCKY